MFRASCPRCNGDNDVIEDALNTLVECGCGVKLMLLAPESSLPPEISVACGECGEAYDVDAADAGEEMECECGADVQVPHLVVATARKKKLKKKSADKEESSNQGFPAIQIAGSPKPKAAAADQKTKAEDAEWKRRAKSLEPGKKKANAAAKTTSSSPRTPVVDTVPQKAKGKRDEPISIVVPESRKTASRPKVPAIESPSGKSKEKRPESVSIVAAENQKAPKARSGDAAKRQAGKKASVESVPVSIVTEKPKTPFKTGPDEPVKVKAAPKTPQRKATGKELKVQSKGSAKVASTAQAAGKEPKVQVTDSAKAASGSKAAWRNRAATLSSKADPTGELKVGDQKTPAKSSETKVAELPTSWEPVDPLQMVDDTKEKSKRTKTTKKRSGSGKSDSGDEEDTGRVKRAKPTPWVEIWGGVGVGILLLVASIAYLMRGDGTNSRKVAQTETAAAASASEISDPEPTNDRAEPALKVDESEPDNDLPAEELPAEDLSAEELPASQGDVTSPAPMAVAPEASSTSIMGNAGGDSFMLGGETAGGELPEIDLPAPNSIGTSTDAADVDDAADIDVPQASSSDYAPPIALADITRPKRTADETKTKPTKKPRPIVPIPDAVEKFLTFDRAYKLAYDAQQEFLKVKGESKSAVEIHEALGQSISRFNTCRAVADEEVPDEQMNQILYTIAGLYLEAGHIYEAGVFAMHVVRHAKPTEPVAKASATIALVAFQEAYQTQFGDKNYPGELLQISVLGDLMQTRWPRHPQLDLIRYSTAQMLEADAFPILAATEYAKVSPESEFYGKAQATAGRILWSTALTREKNDDTAQIEGIVSAASKLLDDGIKASDSAEKPTATMLATKLSRAQIFLRRKNPQGAVRMLGGKAGVLRFAGEKVPMSDEFITLANELLFSAHSQLGNVEKVQATLAVLAKRYGADGKERVASLYTSLAKEFIEKLPKDNTVSTEQIDQLEKIVGSITKGNREISVSTRMWLAKSWSALSPRAASASDKERCAANSNEIFTSLLNDTSLEPGVLLSIRLTLVDSYEAAEQYDEAIATLSEILSEKPNTLDLQSRACEILQSRAEHAAGADSAREAISGLPDTDVWGLQQLCKTFMKLHFANEETDEYSERMLNSVMMLNQSRVELARRLKDSPERTAVLKAAASQVSQTNATLVPKGSDWKPRLQTLEAQIAKLRK